jgi:hypothetical protein
MIYNETMENTFTSRSTSLSGILSSILILLKDLQHMKALAMEKQEVAAQQLTQAFMSFNLARGNPC